MCVCVCVFVEWRLASCVRRQPCSHLPPPPLVQVDKTKLKSGVRVALDVTTLTIMRLLPREVDPAVFQMLSEDPGKVRTAAPLGVLV